MSFREPLWLLTLLLVPLVFGAWWERRRRPPRYAVRYPALPTVREAVESGGVRTRAWRPLVPAALLLAALTALAVALARPQQTIAVPLERATIMLVTDHSGSMRADDVKPDRLAAAVKSAHTFLSQLPKAIRVGVVTYSTEPDAVQAPTTDRGAVGAVIDQQFPDGATATGNALQVALGQIENDKQNGKRPPAAIVLLSDGATTAGRDPVGVAIAAGRAHIPIYTVALGTPDGVVPVPGGYADVPPDPETLGAIARESGGQAFKAQDSGRLASIYKSLGSQLGSKKRKHETTAAFAIGGLVLLLGAAVTSVRFSPALP